MRRSSVSEVVKWQASLEEFDKAALKNDVKDIVAELASDSEGDDLYD